MSVNSGQIHAPSFSLFPPSFPRHSRESGNPGFDHEEEPCRARRGTQAQWDPVPKRYRRPEPTCREADHRGLSEAIWHDLTQDMKIWIPAFARMTMEGGARSRKRPPVLQRRMNLFIPRASPDAAGSRVYEDNLLRRSSLSLRTAPRQQPHLNVAAFWSAAACRCFSLPGACSRHIRQFRGYNTPLFPDFGGPVRSPTPRCRRR
jgi:hypothetical protein